MMTWINIHNPSEIVACSWYSQGVDIEGEKGVGKALTYAEKYFLLKFLISQQMMMILINTKKNS